MRWSGMMGGMPLKANDVETVAVSDLSEDSENVNTHDEASIGAIKASLLQFGQQKPIVAKNDGTVVAGNGTLVAARELGWDEIQVSYTSLEDDDLRAYAIADNRTAQLARWDADKLQAALGELEANGYDVRPTGFDPATLAVELDKMNRGTLGDARDEEQESGGSDEAEPADDAESITAAFEDCKGRWSCKDGQLWRAGEHYLYVGDCREVMAGLAPSSVDSIVTDPPYGLEFMGKGWDKGVPGVEFWRAALAVAKPGAHLVAFGGTRTYHRQACAIEDAGWEMRDCLMWLYGSGFPKSLQVDKALDRAAIAPDPEDLLPEESQFCDWLKSNTADALVRAELGQRFVDRRVEVVNTATKDNPRMGRRALVPTAVAWSRFLESDGAPTDVPEWVHALVKDPPQANPNRSAAGPGGWFKESGCSDLGGGSWNGWGTALKPAWEPAVLAMKPTEGTFADNAQAHGVAGLNVDGARLDGRWPANVTLDQDAASMLDEQAGGAEPSRFFYTSKASAPDRGGAFNMHPTVKPTDLMEWLCRLTSTPTGGLVLDPFAGSGSTMVAAQRVGRPAIGIEQDPGHCAIILQRLADLGLEPEMLG